jgi:hypothetical protein
MDRRNFIWSTPVVISILLPQHALATDHNLPRPPTNVLVQNYVCSDNVVKILSSFEICNDESEDIQIISFSGGNIGSEFAVLVSPSLPVTIHVGQCVMFNIEGGINPYGCGGLFDVVLGVRSLSPEGLIEGTVAVAL